jgi:hypothetical protein
VTELFTLEWLGGVAEHHFRKARPENDLPWGSLDASRYSASLLAAAREVWTGVAVSEYAAISAFSEVVGALAAARAPLDLIGMTSDFLADEVLHVELASRLLMQLGGAAPRSFDAATLAPTTTPGLTPLQRANELVVRIGCVAETFASETAVPMMRETTHPLVRGVYQTILRDEARHCRLAGLYFDWAGDRLDEEEKRRLGAVAVTALGMYAPLWRRAAHETAGPAVSEWSPSDIHELGWIEPERYVPLARGAVTDTIVPSLRALGLVLPEAPLAALLAD